MQVNPPSAAAGSYPATGAQFGPAPTSPGLSGSLVLVNNGVGLISDACSTLVGFPAGAIAIVDRSSCSFVDQAANAQAAGAVAVVVVNNVSGAPETLTGTATFVTIPSVMVSQTSGATIKAGLPSTGILAAAA